MEQQIEIRNNIIMEQQIEIRRKLKLSLSPLFATNDKILFATNDKRLFATNDKLLYIVQDSEMKKVLLFTGNFKIVQIHDILENFEILRNMYIYTNSLINEINLTKQLFRKEKYKIKRNELKTCIQKTKIFIYKNKLCSDVWNIIIEFINIHKKKIKV